MITYMYNDTIVITNRRLVKGDYLKQIERAASLHPYGLILREKDLSDEEYAKLAIEVLKICQANDVVCFLHSRCHIARKLGCQNIHLSVRSLTEQAEELRYFKNISVSCHSLEDVLEAIAYGATQIVLGTIFETECKKGLKGRGVAFVREIADYCRIHGDVPVFAIGGITPENIGLVKEAGAKGGCMMSYMMKI